MERWALVGVAAVVMLAITVVLSARPEQDDALAPTDGSTGKVRIGGEAAADPGPRVPSPTPRDDPAWTPEDEPPVQPPPQPAATREYVVQKDDTLGAIAQRELGSVKRVHEIVRLNDLSNPNAIRAGQAILLPAR